MKKAFPILLIVIGVAFAIGGVYTVVRGLDARKPSWRPPRSPPPRTRRSPTPR
jgi:hypothetical protein